MLIPSNIRGHLKLFFDKRWTKKVPKQKKGQDQGISDQDRQSLLWAQIQFLHSLTYMIA